MSLSSCLSKAGGALPLRDRTAIMASAMKYRATGLDGTAAAKRAVEDRLGAVRTEIAQASAAAVNQGQDDEVRGTFSPSTNTITLLKKANLSTFAHETGHLYLEILSDLASQEGAPAEIVEDMNKVLKWFGVKGTEQLDGVAQDGEFEQRGPVFDQTQTDAFKRFSNGAPLITSQDALTHQFVNGEPVVVEAFHGTKRPDRVGTKFLKKRATSGPMAFHTSSPELASSYAAGKQDTSLASEDQDYSNWFKVKIHGDRSTTDLVRSWYRLDPATKDRIAELAPRVMFSDEQESDGGNKIELGPEGHDSGTGSYDYNLAATRTTWDRRGNPLKALIEDWLNSGNLFDDEQRFMQVLKLAGFPMEAVEYDSPHAEYPFVYKNYISMQKPLVSSEVPQDVVDALNAAAKKDRSRAKPTGADSWDKNTRTLKEWVAAFNSEDNKYAWTSIPDKVTEVFKSLGYDGIIDWSGKGGGPAALVAPVYIPFEETQVKSAIGNKGTFNREKRDILFQGKEWDDHQNPLPEAHAIAEELRRMGAGAGWALEGGSIIRTGISEPGDQGMGGKVIGRTPWIPAEEWFGRMRSELGKSGLSNAKAIQAAVEKAVTGQKMSAAETRTIDWMRGEVDRMQTALFNLDDEAASDALAAGLSTPDAADIDLVAMAAEINADAVERAAIEHENDSSAFMAAVKEVIDGQAKDARAGADAGGAGVPKTQGEQPAAAQAATEVATPLETWRAMSLEQKRPFHEQFARGWEGYLFEGKSPTTGLSKVFRRFSQWMLQIYKSIKNLAAPLNADMRGVFDRLVASEEEIKAAEIERQMAPLFKDAKAAGMTEEEFAAYQALGQESQDDAIEQLGLRSVRDMKWLSNARDRLLREFQATAAKERKAIRDEVTAEVDAQPVEQARVELRKLAEADPETKKALTDWKARKKQQGEADLAAVRAEYLAQQPDLAGLQKGQFLAKNKREIELEAARRTLQWERENPAPDRPSNPISLDAVATQFGFEDGAALGRALIESPRRGDLIDAMTDQRMMERHGDLINQDAVNAAVNEALHNEARARFVATELTALDKAVGKPRVLMDAARRFAAELIGRKLIKDVRPSVFQTAETRAAAEAAGTKDIAVRVAAKRAQLFNHFAVKEATNALDEVERGIKYLRRLETSESIDPEYKEQIDALLAGFDLRASTTNKQIKRTQSLQAWLDKQREAGIEPDIPEALLLETERGSYKALTVDEFRGLVDTVRQIEHLGRLKHKLLMAKDAKEIAAIREEMAASIIANGGKPRPPKLEGSTDLAKFWDGFTAAHRKLSSLFRQMDGGKDDGPMWQFIGRSMNERGTWEDARIEQSTVELRRLYDKVTSLPGGVSGWRSKINIKEINASLTRGGRLAVALNWGNEDNRQRLLGNYEGGNHWSESQVRAIMKTLTPDELAFVNGVWAHLDSYWPEIAAKQKRLTGKEPERVVPAPFTVTASDGTEVAMTGGYYPLKYDQERSVRASNQDQQQLAKDMMRGAVTSATTRRGHTKERVQEVKRPVRLDLNVITEHVSQVVHDLAWHEWLIDTNRLLKSDDVSGAIASHYGMEAYKTIQKGLEDIASGGLERSTAIDAVLLQVRSNITRATMGASLTTAFLQPFGLTQSVVRIGAKHVMRGAARWAGDAMQMENTLAWIQDKSDFMRLRSKAFNRELREIRGTVKGKSKTMQVIDTGLFVMMQKMQLIADVPTWVGQYEKTKEIGAEYKDALARGLDEEEAARLQESAAVAQADRAVMEAQGSGHIKDLSEVQRKHPMLTQFYSYFNSTLQLAAESTAKTDFKNPRAVAGWLGDMALLMVIPSILPALLMHLIKSGGAGDDEPEEWAKRLAKWQAGYLLGLTVGLREGSGLLEGFDYAGPPVGRLVGDIGKAGKQTAQGEVDEAAVMAYINLMGSAFGVPTIQATRSYKGWKAWDEGQEGAGPQSVLFGPPPKK